MQVADKMVYISPYRILNILPTQDRLGYFWPSRLQLKTLYTNFYINNKSKVGNNYMKKFTLLIILAFAVDLGIFSHENNKGLFSLFSGSSTQQNAVSIDFGTLV